MPGVHASGLCQGQKFVMDISVVIPVWNRKEFLARAITSVQQQTTKPLEIVVVDDGSTDGGGEMVSREFPEVVLLTQSNLGVSAARNRGINCARGQWIAFLDSDDTWLPEKLARQTTLLENNRDVKVCHTDEIWIRNGVRVNPKHRHAKPRGWIFDQCLPLCCVSPSSVLLHRSVLDDIGLFDESLPACEDYDLWLRLFHKYQAGLVAEPLLIKYGGHPDQLSRRYWGMDRFRVTALEKILQSGSLEPRQRNACAAMLDEKCTILAKGFSNRGKIEQANRYLELRQQWSHAQAEC